MSGVLRGETGAQREMLWRDEGKRPRDAGAETPVAQLRAQEGQAWRGGCRGKVLRLSPAQGQPPLEWRRWTGEGAHSLSASVDAR